MEGAENRKFPDDTRMRDELMRATKSETPEEVRGKFGNGPNAKHFDSKEKAMDYLEQSGIEEISFQEKEESGKEAEMPKRPELAINRLRKENGKVIIDKPPLYGSKTKNYEQKSQEVLEQRVANPEALEKYAQMLGLKTKDTEKPKDLAMRVGGAEKLILEEANFLGLPFNQLKGKDVMEVRDEVGERRALLQRYQLEKENAKSQQTKEEKPPSKNTTKARTDRVDAKPEAINRDTEMALIDIEDPDVRARLYQIVESKTNNGSNFTDEELFDYYNLLIAAKDAGLDYLADTNGRMDKREIDEVSAEIKKIESLQDVFDRGRLVQVFSSRGSERAKKELEKQAVRKTESKDVPKTDLEETKEEPDDLTKQWRALPPEEKQAYLSVVKDYLKAIGFSRDFRGVRLNGELIPRDRNYKGGKRVIKPDQMELINREAKRRLGQNKATEPKAGEAKSQTPFRLEIAGGEKKVWTMEEIDKALREIADGPDGSGGGNEPEDATEKSVQQENAAPIKDQDSTSASRGGGSHKRAGGETPKQTPETPKLSPIVEDGMESSPRFNRLLEEAGDVEVAKELYYTEQPDGTMVDRTLDDDPRYIKILNEGVESVEDAKQIFAQEYPTAARYYADKEQIAKLREQFKREEGFKEELGKAQSEQSDNPDLGNQNKFQTKYYEDPETPRQKIFRWLSKPFGQGDKHIKLDIPRAPQTRSVKPDISREPTIIKVKKPVKEGSRESFKPETNREIEEGQDDKQESDDPFKKIYEVKSERLKKVDPDSRREDSGHTQPEQANKNLEGIFNLTSRLVEKNIAIQPVNLDAHLYEEGLARLSEAIKDISRFDKSWTANIGETEKNNPNNPKILYLTYNMVPEQMRQKIGEFIERNK